MKVDRVIPCICAEDYENRKYESSYYGMPQLKVTDVYRGNQYFEAFCPNCGRGGMFQYRSAFLALRAWNELQDRIRKDFLDDDE